VLQRVAACSHFLQRVAVCPCCSMLLRVVAFLQRVAVCSCCSVLQRVAA